MPENADALRGELEEMARPGFRGYPVGTVAYYGPDDRVATKVVAAVIVAENADADPMRKWVSGDLDVRQHAGILQQVLDFLRSNQVKSVVVTPGIFGCPHESGLDYPEGRSCPQCPFWATHDRRAMFRRER